MTRLFFTLDDRWAGERKDVVAEVGRATPAGRLTGALGGERDAEPWWVGDRRLGAEDDVLGSLRDGVTVVRGSPEPPPTPQPTDRAVELRVVGGPESGRTWRLVPGAYSIGRAEDADLSLGTDPLVSRRHARLVVSPDAVSIRDEGSANGVVVGGARVTEAGVPPREIVQIGESALLWSWPEDPNAVVVADGSGGLSFNRPPRIVAPAEAVNVAFPGAPPQRQRSTFPVAASLAPLGLGVLMAALFREPQFLLFTLLSPIMMISNYVTSRRSGTKSHRERKAQYERDLERARSQLERTVVAETAESRHASPDPAEVAAIAAGPRARLWERRRWDADFLVLRVGLCDRRATATVSGVGDVPDVPDAPGAAVSDQVSGAPEGASQSSGMPRDEPILRQVPATIDVPAAGVVGVAGPRHACDAGARWLVAQAASLHSADDLVVTILTGPQQKDEWYWARWLPHLRAGEEDRIARIGNTERTVATLAGELAGIVEERVHAAATTGVAGAARFGGQPAHLVVLDGAYRLGAVPALTQVLRRGPAVGVFAVCIDDAERLLPEECKATAVFDANAATRLVVRTATDQPATDVLADSVSSAWAEGLARALAPIRLNRRAESTAALPSAVRLLEVLGLEPPSVGALQERWDRRGPSTEAVMGESAAGPFALDLRLDGPHALVAGTTGSGKSELLQTLIASLAVTNRPDQMNFVLVDYKGGSAFKDCARLPHTVGMVTDLDAHLTQRALASLGAELRRRERILQRAGAKDLEDYLEALRKAGGPELARLVIVIDEFAALAEELPAFVEGLVDLARRGRSLGIHLVLATQRPSGVVSPAIKTNTNLRLCMRVTDASDSVDVIDSPLASRIAKESPGRAFARAGHQQLTEFQVARVGGWRLAGGQEDPVLVRGVEWEALGELHGRGSAATGAEETDLSVLVSSMKGAADISVLLPPASPWLEPLPDMIVLESAHSARTEPAAHDMPAVVTGGRPKGAPGTSGAAGSLAAAFGVEDRPAEQRRVPAVFDVAGGGHMVIGGDPGAGRSTFLRTLAGSIADCCATRDVHLYAIDCGNGALLPLAELPQCGAVVSRLETDRVDRLLAKLLAEVTRRQQMLATGGFASIGDQRAAASPEDRLPYVVVLLDRWEGYVSEFEVVDNGRLVSSFQHLMREAPGVGIRVIVTGDRSALSSRFASLVEQTIVLRLNDRTSYATVGLNPRHLPERFAPGRGFRAPEGTEIQVALLDADPSGPAQVGALRSIAARAHARDKGTPRVLRPEPVAVLPQQLALSSVSSPTARHGDPPAALVGVGGDWLEPFVVDLADDGPGFVVAGPPRTGRSNALAVMARSLLGRGSPLVVVTARPSPLHRLAAHPGVLGVLDGRRTARDQFDELVQKGGEGLVVVVDDAEHLTDTQLAEPLAVFVRGARDHAQALVLAGTTTDLASGFRGFVPEARKSRAGLLLCPDAPMDGELIGVRLARTSVFPGPPGRGVLVTRAGMTLVQVPLDDTSLES